jgi:hypothetical protein
MRGMAVPIPDLDELLHIHVRYELDMLFGTFEQLRNPVPSAIVGNALIESFCMHASLKQGQRARDDLAESGKQIATTMRAILRG